VAVEAPAQEWVQKIPQEEVAVVGVLVQDRLARPDT
jgi:hypothetical protein